MTGLTTAMRRRSTASNDDAERTCPSLKGYKTTRSGILPSQPFITKFLLYFSTILGETFLLVIVTHIPHSGRT